jgi:hypothetical protein
MERSQISEAIQTKARTRAKELCEYCHAVERWQYVRFTIDHVIPLQRGGTNNLDNLALACFHCNRQKSANISGFDPVSTRETRLFNPRQDIWSENFVWDVDAITLVGLTDIGRATIAKLAMNRERVLLIREADREIGRHPPNGDRQLLA